MLACDTCDAWTQFLDYVKTRCSATAFGNWLLPIHVVESSQEAVVLEIPNIFVKEYLLSNYKAELCSFLPVDAEGEPAIKFVVSAPAKKITQTAPTFALAPPVQEEAINHIKLNPTYRFETFIEGPANQFVKSAGIGVATRPGQSYNPLFIHGGVGLGKTHILHAIGHHVLEHQKNLSVQCITTEAFHQRPRRHSAQ